MTADKPDMKVAIIVPVVVGLVVTISVGAFFLCRWIMKRKGNVFNSIARVLSLDGI